METSSSTRSAASKGVWAFAPSSRQLIRRWQVFDIYGTQGDEIKERIKARLQEGRDETEIHQSRGR